MTTPRHLTVTLVATAAVLAIATTAIASAAAYTTGRYAGRTGQGAPITFTANHAHLVNINTHVVDRCQPTTGDVSLTGLTASLSRNGALRLAKHLPSGVRVKLTGTLRGKNGARGTIALSDGSCQIREMFSATRLITVKGKHEVPVATPTNLPKVKVNDATIGPRGTQVDVTVAALPDDTGAPQTSDSLLVYVAAGPCATTYAAAIAQATTGTVIGFVANSSIAAAYDSAHSYADGAYTFQLTTGTPFAGEEDAAFTTACAMRYSGPGGTVETDSDVVLGTDQAPLVAGTGPANTQP